MIYPKSTNYRMCGYFLLLSFTILAILQISSRSNIPQSEHRSLQGLKKKIKEVQTKLRKDSFLRPRWVKKDDFYYYAGRDTKIKEVVKLMKNGTINDVKDDFQRAERAGRGWSSVRPEDVHSMVDAQKDLQVLAGEESHEPVQYTNVLEELKAKIKVAMLLTDLKKTGKWSEKTGNFTFNKIDDFHKLQGILESLHNVRHIAGADHAKYEQMAETRFKEITQKSCRQVQVESMKKFIIQNNITKMDKCEWHIHEDTFRPDSHIAKYLDKNEDPARVNEVKRSGACLSHHPKVAMPEKLIPETKRCVCGSEWSYDPHKLMLFGGSDGVAETIIPDWYQACGQLEAEGKLTIIS